MPLARSNTRSRSRSPIPPPGFHSSPSPRPFLPPSHYATAGGIAYTGGLRPPTQNDNINSPNSDQLPSSFISHPHSPDSKSHYQNLDSFMPLSCPSESSTSDSSFEFKPNASPDSRFSSINLKRNKSSSSSASSSSCVKRQSHLTNLPLLEAQLLPSLRDTIDRMTKPPSRISNASYPSSPSHLEPPNRSASGRSLSPSCSPSPLCAQNSSYSSSVTATLCPPSSTQILSSPKSVSSPRSGPNIPMSVEPSTPKAKPPLSAKSVLKSALRPPTPKLFSGKSIDADSPVRSPSSGVSLRSMRSILGRKTPTAGPSENDPMVGKTGSKSTGSPSTRERSRTDPGTAPTPKSPAINHVAPSLNSNSPSPFYANPNSNAKMFTSNLPRLLPFNHFDGKSTSRRGLHVDDSDFEYKYEAEGRDRRNLVVTNADAALFSSSSESETETRVAGTQTRERYSGGRHGERRLVGLGFGLEGGPNGGTRGRGIVLDQRSWDGGGEDDLSVYEDEGVQDVEHPFLSGNQSSSGHHAYDSEPESRGRGSLRAREIDDLEEAHRRRRTALMGIVNGLELGLGSVHGSDLRDNQSEGESDYCGREGVGVAVSGSGDVGVEQGGRMGGEQEVEGSEEGSEYGDEDEGGVWQESRIPTFLVSGEDGRSRTAGGERSRLPALRSSSAASHIPPPSSCRHIPPPSPRVDGDGNKGRKSPSRSPVIRQPESEDMPMPAALKRHSVYHDRQSPSGSPRISIGERNHEIVRRDEHRTDADRTRTREHKQEHDPGVSNAVTVAQDSYAAVSRERKAFGIPPSESEEVYRSFGRQQPENGMLPRVDSDLSSVGSTLWHEEYEELSVGAEALFRKLSGGQMKEVDRRSYQMADNDVGDREDEDFLPEQDSVQGSRSRSRTPMSQSSSASSVYETPQPEDGSSEVHLESRTWRSDISAAAYTALVDRHGEAEMQRQEIIWELRNTEESFVRRLHTIVQLFILPLRLQNSKTWISGVPSEVTHLFDWLEDILNLHTQMLAALQAVRVEQYPVVERIAESMRAFVPRLEVYQPYLVRLIDVANMIARLVRDERSDFGQFVKIQERAEQCDGWNLERYLVEPVNRLAKYPDLFRQLQHLTPRIHPDYLPTFSLLHSTEMVIRVMTEVKIREDEYDLIKNIAGRIQGLPSSVQLARRERRLLTEGLLQRTEINDHTRESIHAYSSSNVSILHDGSGDRLSASKPQTVVLDTLKRSSRLVDAINDWDTRRGRSGSVKSTASSGTGVSFKSYGTSSTGDSNLPLTPLSAHFPSRCGVISPSQISPPDSRYARSISRGPPRSKHPLSGFPSPECNETLHPVPVQVFVFTDLILLATPDSERQNGETREWCLLEDIGMSRILGVTEYSDEDSAASPLIILDILPVDVKNLDQGVIPQSASVKTIYLTIPREPSKTRSEKDSIDETRQTWLSAFQQCFQSTLRSLSLPSHSGGYPVQGPNVDLEFDTRHSVLGILASGLPLPKSPSVQLDDVQRGQVSDARRQEREERGWWSLRFQQVLRELQRQDVPFMFGNV